MPPPPPVDGEKHPHHGSFLFRTPTQNESAAAALFFFSLAPGRVAFRHVGGCGDEQKSLRSAPGPHHLGDPPAEQGTDNSGTYFHGASFRGRNRLRGLGNFPRDQNTANGASRLSRFTSAATSKKPPKYGRRIRRQCQQRFSRAASSPAPALLVRHSPCAGPGVANLNQGPLTQGGASGIVDPRSTRLPSASVRLLSLETRHAG